MLKTPKGIYVMPFAILDTGSSVLEYAFRRLRQQTTAFLIAPAAIALYRNGFPRTHCRRNAVPYRNPPAASQRTTPDATSPTMRDTITIITLTSTVATIGSTTAIAMTQRTILIIRRLAAASSGV